ncbi:MAG: efflux RND transporter periplasmic adaptor subunit [Gammaproteobacteria bacterium]|nr:efflux RND transporter periplasmic adaptor subunit [Gammaproteobacteria bacterium]
MSSRLGRIFGLLGLIALVALVVWFLSRPKPVAVTVAEVERGAVLATVANTRAGTVDACDRARLAPPMGGQIARLPFTEGNRVQKGDILLELWNDDQRAQVTQAEREAVSARSRTREACVTASVAAKNAVRIRQLRKQNLVSEGETERAVGEADSRAAACDAARDQEKVSQARIDVARAQLERTILRAPFTGVIAEINGEVGEFVTPSPVGIPTPPTVDLVDGSCLYISAPIDEVDAPSVRAGQRALITLDAFPNRRFPGVVRRVAPYVLDIEKQARTVEVEAEIESPEKYNLLPGYSADVEIVLENREDVLRIPAQAILDGKRVLVLNTKAGVLESRPIDKGVSNWEFSEIVSGLDAGELVVTSVDREGVADGVAATRE